MENKQLPVVGQINHKILRELSENPRSIFSDPDIYFHGTRNDPNIIRSILAQGIHSKSSNPKIVRSYPHGYNSDNQISLSVSPAKKLHSSSLLNYSLKQGRVGFLIKENTEDSLSIDDLLRGKRKITIARKDEVKSQIPDEVFAIWSIPPENIQGILIDENLLDQAMQVRVTFDNMSLSPESITEKTNYFADQYAFEESERELTS